MGIPEWKVGHCEYNIIEGGQVKVTVLHYTASLFEEPYSASLYGTTPDDGNRVYALPALQAVPNKVIVGWCQAALGAEEVARIEAALASNIAEQKTPTVGGLTPAEDEEEVT